MHDEGLRSDDEVRVGVEEKPCKGANPLQGCVKQFTANDAKCAGQNPALVGLQTGGYRTYLCFLPCLLLTTGFLGIGGYKVGK